MQTLYWKFYGAINILTELALVTIPVYVIVMGATIAQLVFLGRLRNRQNITFDIWPYHLATQFVVSLSIITVCIPYIRNVLLGFESGMFQTGHFRLGKLGQVRNARLNSPPKDVSNTTGTAATDSLGQACDRDGTQVFDGQAPQIENVPFERNQVVAEAITPDAYWDTGSQTSQANIIRTTREWIVDYDDRSRHVGPA
ncbi:MAG: hypothetical protein Q9224_001399 [Gallowayella concinna]